MILVIEKREGVKEKRKEEMKEEEREREKQRKEGGREGGTSFQGVWNKTKLFPMDHGLGKPMFILRFNPSL